MKSILLKKRSLYLTLLVDLMLVASILFLMKHVQYLLNEDVRINLTEIVTQNKDVISSRLSVELNNLELEAKQLADRFQSAGNPTEAEKDQIFVDFAAKSGAESLIWADATGRAVTSEGAVLDISGRNYFRSGIQGIPNISDRMVSRIDGEDIFAICVPMVIGGEIVGTIQRPYSPQTIYDIFAVSLFSEKASTYIINSEGYIRICSQSSEYNRETDNYYRIVYLTDPSASTRLEQDIRNNRSGFMEATIDGAKVFSAYTPIEQLNDWYLITSIATDAVSPNANVVVRLFYVILFVVAVLFTFSMLYFFRLKRRQQLNLEKVAFVDPVTLGDNFTKFTVDLHALLKQNPDQTYYICTFDIDSFKYINSFYGFETGDRILRTLHETCKARLTPGERIGRISGDRFVLLLENADADRLQELISTELELESIQIYLSAGLYTIGDREESVSLMVDKASTAAQKAKGKHFKHVQLYTEAYDQETARNEQTKRAVEQALAKGEIIPFFQPKVDIKTRRLVGAEALARWKTADGKLIAPYQFIPICEQTGLITVVDFAIFEQTLRFISGNLKRGVSCVPISVNFSRLHMLDAVFLDRVLDRLRHYEVSPELVELEITETVIYDNYENMEAFISNLHQHGLHISMDDFGTGYSSLHMLKDVEIDVLKIDQGFLKDTAESERQKIIFGSIVQMAKKLGIKVVVEGVETLENVHLMEEFGASYAQGYYFAKPMDEESFQVLYQEGSV